MRRFLRILGIATGVLLILLAVAAAGGWLWLRSSLPRTDGTIESAAVGAPVDILRDKDGIPHIFATTQEDAYAALGYTHAQDRLWQMETMRRLGAGRLSEIFGAATVKFDRYSRTLGLYRLAEAQVARLAPDERKMLDAYARGVNAFLDDPDGALPPEFVVMRHTPEAWRPADSLVWAKIMAMRLSRNWQTELLRWRLSRTLPDDRIRELWPSEDDSAPITFTNSLRAAAVPLDGLAAAIPDAFTSADASNAWVISGKRTETGKPILANDPHLGFDAPILWYLVHLEAPGLSLTGATVPGVPLLILGHNSRIAWGMTTTGGDLEDLFLEKPDPEDPQKYVTPDGSMPYRQRTEEIAIRDAEPLPLVIRETRHGPVVSDLIAANASPGKGEAADDLPVIALASAALKDADDTPRALIGINRAANWKDFVDATRYFHAPQQNLFFADINGDIGLTSPAHLPVRRSGNGLAPVSGADAVHDWTGFVPFEALPRIHNPPAGVIVNANNQLVGTSYPHLITRDWDTSWRARRIDELFAQTRRHSMKGAADLQMDTLSTAARALMPLLLSAPALTPHAKETVELMRDWDFQMRRDRPEPLIYAAWSRQLMKSIAADELGALFDDFGRTRPGFLLTVLTGNRHWCDDVGTKIKESCDERIAHALDAALQEITRLAGDDRTAWRWGVVHQAEFTHRIFSRIPLIGGPVEMAIATDGGNDTINRGQTAGIGRNPYRHTHGAGLRAVYDLSDLSRSRFSIATGQSGNPFSPHYRDHMERWRDGRATGIATDRATAQRRAVGTLVLRPAPKP